MGIYIKGMEMPEDDELLYLKIYPNGKVAIDMDLECKQIATAVPVQPHGDLIDRDALAERFLDGQCYFTDAIKSKLQTAPTILEAEEE